MHYSLWIKPTGKAKEVLQRTINEFSRKYNAPEFEAHMTLLGDLQVNEKDVLRKAETIASGTKPFPITTGKIEISTTFFQCVFVRVDTTAPLMETHVKARNLFGKVKDYVFMPHISLIYGDFDIRTREKIMREIKLPKLNFTAKDISIITSREETRDPQEWQQLDKISLGG